MAETVIGIAAAVARGELSPSEVVDDALARIDERDGALNSFVAVDAESARAQARALEARLAAGESVGALAGVPIGVKDLEDAAGFVTTCGDPARRNLPPAVRDSVQVARMRAAGAIVIGKTNTPAYGFHAETDNLIFGPTHNPWALDRTSGGSSGGSAAAVAGGLVSLCTGSDGGGSIRIPSAVCGLPGFKPSNGVVPNGDDDAPTWGPFSTRGPMARTFAEHRVRARCRRRPFRSRPAVVRPRGIVRGRGSRGDALGSPHHLVADARAREAGRRDVGRVLGTRSRCSSSTARASSRRPTGCSASRRCDRGSPRGRGIAAHRVTRPDAVGRPVSPRGAVHRGLRRVGYDNAAHRSRAGRASRQPRSGVVVRAGRCVGDARARRPSRPGSVNRARTGQAGRVTTRSRSTSSGRRPRSSRAARSRRTRVSGCRSRCSSSCRGRPTCG